MPSNKADTLTNDLPAIQVMPMKYRDLLSYIQISISPRILQTIDISNFY